MRYLSSDLDWSDPEDDLHDIQCGKYMDALSNLPSPIRQMMQDSDMFVDAEERNGKWVVSKILVKRDPGTVDGRDIDWAILPDGTRYKVDPEIAENYRAGYIDALDTDVVSLDSGHLPPKDKWDIVFDSKKYHKRANRLLESEQFIGSPDKDLKWMVKYMCESGSNIDLRYEFELDGNPVYISQEQHANKYNDGALYKHSIRTPQGKLIAKKIEEGISGRELYNLINKTQDRRPQLLQELKMKIPETPLGPKRVILMKQIQSIKGTLIRQLKEDKLPMPIPRSEISTLWDMWKMKENEEGHSTKVADWKIKKLKLRNDKKLRRTNG